MNFMSIYANIYIFRQNLSNLKFLVNCFKNNFVLHISKWIVKLN